MKARVYAFSEIKVIFTILVMLLLISQKTNAQFTFSNNQLNNYWSSLPPLNSNNLTFPNNLPPINPSVPLNFGTMIQNNGVTIIDTPDGKVTYGFTGGQNLLTVETPQDTYTSTVENVHFIPGLTTNILTGENLSFTSSSNDSRTDIDRFTFIGGDSEFRFTLHDFHHDGTTDWGGEKLDVHRKDDLINATAKKVYVQDEEGQFIEIGEAKYSEANNSIEMTSVLGSHSGKSFSADQIKFMRDGDTDTGTAQNLFISNGPNEFVNIGTANLTISPDRKSLGLSSINGETQGYIFSADTFNLTEDENDRIANATGIFVKNANGEFIQIGEANYSESENKLEMTSVLGQYNSTNFSADQLAIMRDGNTDIGTATNLFIRRGPNEFVQVGTADLRINPDRKSLSLSSILGESHGYNFSADTFNVVEENDNISANATKVFVRNTEGNFVQIGEANYSDVGNRLEMTSILGQYDGTDFSADQLELFKEGNTDIGKGTNLFISQGPNEFVQVGTAELRLSPDKKSLSLSSIFGEAQGYNFSANTFNYEETPDNKIANATGVFIRNASGDFIQIGEADYSEAENSLRVKSLLGEYDGTNFSADQLELLRSGDTDIGRGTNLFISRGANEFVQIGSADLEIGPRGNSLRLLSITGETNGFHLSADEVSGTSFNDNTNLQITNGSAIRNDERLTFGSAVIDSTSERTSVDVHNLLLRNKDLSYSTDRLTGSTNGDSFDLDTTGVLKTGGNNIDVTFDAKGVNSLIIAEPTVVKSSDGKILSAEGMVSIGTTDDGGISEIGVALGDTISFSATDADGNAKELTASFSYNEETGKFFLKTVFKEGDKTEIKVMPFKFTSEKIGDDAVAALSASLEKQNIESYLNIVTGIIDLQRVNDFLAVGENRMQVRLGREMGLEFYYANDNLNFLEGLDGYKYRENDSDNIAIGLGLFNRGESGAVHSGGVLLSSDSSLRYNVEAGTLSFNGIDLPDRGEVPLTIGTYYRYEDDEGNAIFGTLGTSLAELGTVSAGVTVQRRLNDYTNFTAGVSGNNHGEVAARAGIQIFFGKRVNNSSRRFKESNDYYSPSSAGDIGRSIYGTDVWGR